MSRVQRTVVIVAALFVGMPLLFGGSVAQAADRYWVAASAGNWSSTANWSATSGGAGGATVPESGDKAFFDGGGVGNCTLDTNVTVDRIEVASSYSGVVVQAASVTTMTGSLLLDGTFRLGANGKLLLTDSGEPLSGAGTLDTTTNTPNTVEYKGGDDVALAAGAPVASYHNLTLTPPGGLSRSAVFVCNSDEQYADMVAIDQAAGYLYIGSKNSPAKIAKVRLSDYTRVGSLTLASGENDVGPAVVMDSANGFMYLGTRTSPARVVKIRLSDFTRVGAITLNTGENNLWAATLDAANGYAYFGSRTSPGIVVKVRLSDFARESALTLASGENEVLGACTDSAAGYAYFGLQTYPGKVVKVRLSDFTKVGTLTFNTGEDRIRNAVIDAANGFAYFGTRTSPGKVVRVKLSDFTRDAALAMNTGENELYSAVMDAAGGYAYFGTYTNPGSVIKVKLSDFTRTDSVTFGYNEKYLDTACIDPASGFAYFATDNWTGKVVKVNLSYVSAKWTHAAALDVNGNLAIGAGTLACAGQNIAVAGNWSNAGTLQPGLNTVILDGGNQTVSGNNTFRNLTKTVASAATLTFESGKIQQVAGVLNLQGAAGNLLSLRASTTGQPWRLISGDYQTARYADIKDANASEGRPLVALYSTDSGNNQNVIFTSPAQVAITTPAESITSPAWVEGTNSGDVNSVSVVVNGGTAFAATRWTPVKWFADNASSGGASLGVTLSSTAATSVQVTAQNAFSESNVATQNITWASTDLTGKSWSTDTVRIRKGDSLLLTATGSGTALLIDGDGDGTLELSGAPGDKFAKAYNTAGSFTVTAKIDGSEVGSMTVVVVSVNLQGPIACQVNYTRPKEVLVSPAAEAVNVTFQPADTFWLDASVASYTANGANLNLKPKLRGTPVLTARIGGANGPALAGQGIDEFTLDVPARWSAIVDMDSNTGTSKLTIRPFVEGVTVRFEMFASTSTFTGGVTSFEIASDDFVQVLDSETGETVGEYDYGLEIPENEDSYCLNILVKQHGSGWVEIAREGNVNGNKSLARVFYKLLCLNAQGKLEVHTAAKKDSKHTISIHPAGVGPDFPGFLVKGQKNQFLRDAVVCKANTTKENPLVQKFDVQAGEKAGRFDIRVDAHLFPERLIVASEAEAQATSISAAPIPNKAEFVVGEEIGAQGNATIEILNCTGRALTSDMVVQLISNVPSPRTFAETSHPAIPPGSSTQTRAPFLGLAPIPPLSAGTYTIEMHAKLTIWDGSRKVFERTWTGLSLVKVKDN